MRAAPAIGRSSCGQNVDVELVALRVSHASPLETLKLAGAPGLKPPPAERLDLGSGLVQILDHQIEVQPVLACLPFTYALEPHGKAGLGGRENHELAVSYRGLHANTQQFAPEPCEPFRIDGVHDEVPHRSWHRPSALR